MTSATEISESVQDGFLKAIEVGQRLTVEALAAAASTVDGVLPARSYPTFGEGLVTPQEAIDSGFRFAERLLESQKSFVSELVAIATPASTPSTPAKKTTAS
jgi:hypothetical protein